MLIIKLQLAAFHSYAYFENDVASRETDPYVAYKEIAYYFQAMLVAHEIWTPLECERH